MLRPDASLPHRAASGLKNWLFPAGDLAFSSWAIPLAAGLVSGAAAYFSLTVNPGPLIWFMPAIFLVAGLVFGAMRRTAAAGMILLLFATGLLLGIMRSEVRTRTHAQIPAIDTRGDAVPVTGWLESIGTAQNGRARLLIRVPATSATPAYRIRVTGQPGAVRPGDAMEIDAILAPPREAAVPGAYDFSFHAFFDEIAATGYAITTARPGPAVNQDGASRRLARLRWMLAQRIASQLPPRTGALAAALLTGDRSRIDPADAEALRTAGLGHLLAISGMHMALFAGGVFFVVRLAMAAWTPWARGHDPAIPAAVAGLVAAAIYLALSGAAIPTQRAFIMTVSALGAVLLRRRVLSLHTLAVAMIIVVGLAPEAVVSAGFQMSFAAVGALIAMARAWQSDRALTGPFDPAGSVRRFLGGLSMTSFVAGLATSGFAAFHFHRLASWGLIGNLLVMPVFTLVVMPAGALALFLMPVGLDGLALTVMGWGLQLVLTLAHTVSSWPHASGAVTSAPGWVLAAYAAGFALVMAGRRGVRIAGGAAIALALAGWASIPRPDLFVSSGGVVVTRSAAGDWGSSQPRRNRFAGRVFLEGEAAPASDRQMPALDMACDELGCSAVLPDGGRFAVLNEFDALDEDCMSARLIVTRAEVPAHRIRQCRADVLDRARLERQGGALVWAGDGAALRIRHVLPHGPLRPWHRRTVVSGTDSRGIQSAMIVQDDT